MYSQMPKLRLPISLSVANAMILVTFGGLCLLFAQPLVSQQKASLATLSWISCTQFLLLRDEQLNNYLLTEWMHRCMKKCFLISLPWPPPWFQSLLLHTWAVAVTPQLGALFSTVLALVPAIAATRQVAPVCHFHHTVYCLNTCWCFIG